MHHYKSQISSPFGQVCQVKELNDFRFTTKDFCWSSFPSSFASYHLSHRGFCITPGELQFFALAVAQSCNMFSDTFMLKEQPDFRS